jgi:hypothetical protein
MSGFLKIETEQVVSSLKDFVKSANDCAKKFPAKSLRFDLKIGTLVVKSSSDSLNAGEIEFTPSLSILNKQYFEMNQ